MIHVFNFPASFIDKIKEAITANEIEPHQEITIVSADNNPLNHYSILEIWCNDVLLKVINDRPAEMEKVFIKPHTTKGEVIKIACRNDRNKLGNVDPALPQTWLDQHPELNTFFYVTDYNKNIFGEIKHVNALAADNNIELIYLKPPPPVL